MPFYNIFSKTKEKEKPKQTIIIDNREKNSLVPSELIKIGFQIKFEHLLVGDYLVNNTIIERKSLSDLQMSIINKRIFDQLNQLKEQESKLLIIELEEKNEKILHENAIKGFLIYLSLENNIPFILSQNEKDTANYIKVLANRKPHEISLRPKRKEKTKEEQIQFILEGFPNIGPTKAKKLIEKFKSLKNILTASEEELESILGKKTKDFKKIID